MVQAILSGVKTETRRPVNIMPGQDCVSPYGEPGDILWVREAWQAGTDPEYELGTWYQDVSPAYRKTPEVFLHTYYRADKSQYVIVDPYPDEGAHYLSRNDSFIMAEHDMKGFVWKPSIHMPKWAARLFLRVVRVYIDTVQGIKDAQVVREGIIPQGYTPRYINDYRDRFRAVWDKIYAGAGFPWEDNPQVWVIEFEVLKDSENMEALLPSGDEK